MAMQDPGNGPAIKVLYDPSLSKPYPADAVDIVAVSGFGAEGDQIWISDGVNWLSEEHMLPYSTPNSRIMRYSYSLNWVGVESVQKNLPQIADELLKGLMALRKTHHMRPLVFIGHCFGGLVIQKAILLAKLYDEEYPLLTKCVAGVIFIGTPHRGSLKQSQTEIIASIAAAAGHGQLDDMNASMERESDALADLLNEFSRIANIHSIPVHCFFEQFGWDSSEVPPNPARLSLSEPLYPAPDEFGRIPRSRDASPPPEGPRFRVDAVAGSIDGFPSQSFSTDHFSLTKFGKPDNEDFVLLRSQVVNFVESAKVCVASRVTDFSRKYEKCLNALFLSDPRDDMETIEHNNGRLLQGSSTWLQKDPAYIEWSMEQGKRVLWISGDPGKGKTMLAISVVKILLDSVKSKGPLPDTLVAYFFCDNKDNRRTSSLAILRSLLYQIFSQRPDLCASFKSLYDREGDQLFTSPTALQSLWRIFKSCIHGTKVQRVYFVIDALDELKEDSAADLLKLLEPFLDSSMGSEGKLHVPENEPTGDVKWLLTSRNHEHISGSLRNALNVSLEANSNHVQSIVWEFIDRSVNDLQKLKRYDAALSKYVRDILREKSEGTFLYVSIACRELSQPGVRLINTKSVLNRFPRGLVPLYQRILNQIMALQEEDMVEYAMAILRSMVLALRPLTIQELAIAASLPEDCKHDRNLLDEYASLCGSFISRHEDDVHFVHETVKTYLLSISDVFKVEVSKCHADITRHFINYIDDQCSTVSHRDPGSDLLDYPTSFWLHHARQAGGNLPWSDLLSSRFLSEASHSRKQWLDTYWPRNHFEWDKQPTLCTPLQMAAYGGVLGLVTALLARGDALDEADSNGHTALIWAARNGHVQVVDLLLQNRANCEYKTTDGITALVWATINGHLEVVLKLIEGGANIQVTDPMGWTPLHHAAAHGHVEILTSLLDAGADIDAKDISQQTALQRATFCEKLPVLNVLIDNKADITVRDKDGLPLLHLAVRYAHIDLARFWLRHSDDLETGDDQGWTPLMHAAWFGHAEIADCLIKNGAKLEAKSRDGNTPLHLATWNGHASVVQVLLESKADPNCACHRLETPLQQAAWLGDMEVCQLLLNSGVDPNTTSVTGITPLHQAAANGHEAVAKLLLKWGADPNAVDSVKQTPGARAAENNHHSMARLLKNLEAGDEEQSQAQEDTVQASEFETVDPAVCEFLNIPPESCIAQSHGTIGFSKPTKVTALINGVAVHYFMKSGPTGEMFATEHEALRALHSVVPTIVPYSLGHGKFTNSDDHFLLMEFIDTAYRSETTNPTAMSLPQKLAKLHTTPAPIPKGYSQPMFGWPTPTYCGSTQQKNTFCASWGKFYSENRLLACLQKIDEAHGTDRELRVGVETIVHKVVPRLLGNGHLGGRRGIIPVLIHGDLWIGNRVRGMIASWGGPEEITFDPSVCYAHSEYEMGIMRMFGGFSAGFFHEYHRIVPKTEPKEEYEDRIKLYQLYQYLNHYLIFRGGYKDDAMDVMNGLLQTYAREDVL